MKERQFYTPGEWSSNKTPPAQRRKFDTSVDYFYQYAEKDIAPQTKRQKRLVLMGKRWETIYRNRISRGDFTRLNRVELTHEQRAIASYESVMRFVPDNEAGVRLKLLLAETVEQNYGETLDKIYSKTRHKIEIEGPDEESDR